MATTVLGLIQNALSEIGVFAAEQTLTDNNKAFCFDRLNRMVDTWKTQKRYVQYYTHTSYPWAASKASYTIGKGAGADFNDIRPDGIRAANYVEVAPAPDIHTPLDIIEVDEFSQIPAQELSGRPSRLYYRATYPNMTLYPWPYPTVLTDKLELFAWGVLAAFAAVTDTLSLAPGFEEALTQSLAEALAVSYGREITTELANSARIARSNIAQVETPRMINDSPFIGDAGMRFDPVLNSWVW